MAAVILLVTVGAAIIRARHMATQTQGVTLGESVNVEPSKGAKVSSGNVVKQEAKSKPDITATQKAAEAAKTKAPQATAQAAPSSEVQHEPIKRISAAAAGLYSGPGGVTAHTNFEKWLGKSLPYTTDYLDYKGGWQKDFVDSNAWLIQPWGRWVRANPSRRLVLGVPMLENSSYGQFDQGTRGDFDAYFAQLATELIAAGLGNSIIRLGYEANCDTTGPWQATQNPAGYKALFRHQVSVMRAVPGARFQFDWTVCNGLQDGRPLNSFASFYPGDDVVDIIGIDIYDVKWLDVNATPEQRWVYTVNRKMGVNELIGFANAHGKRLSYPEWGLYLPGDNFAGGGDNPYFIEKMASLINATNPLYESYFNVNWGGGALPDFPSGQAAYKQIFGP